MHVRWRGLELPAKVVADERSLTRTFGRFTAEPFERGFGTTVGNSLRRILLSSLEGAAVTKVRIPGIPHEFSQIPGVQEDVTDILLNVKKLVVNMDSDEPKTMRLFAEGPGEVTAELIQADPAITIFNKDQVVATLTAKTELVIEFTVSRGRGYVPAAEQIDPTADQVIGEIPLDAVFSPVERVRFRVEDTRVGQRTNYDKLIVDVWTNGTITPEMALVEAAKILRKHLNPFVQYESPGVRTLPAEIAAQGVGEAELIRKLNMPIAELNLSMRAANCLESAQVRTVADLVSKTENDLLEIRAFGKTSLREVKHKLDELALTLGMSMPEGYAAPQA